MTLRQRPRLSLAGAARVQAKKSAAMQVTETLSEGLKREFKVVVPAAELDAKVNARLDELKDARAHQRLPSGQGAGRASQAHVWPLGDGRGDRGDRARHQQPDRDASAASSSPPIRRSRCREEGRGREADRGQDATSTTRWRSRSCRRSRSAISRTIKLEQAGRRCRRRRDRRGDRRASPSRTSRYPPKAEGEKAAKGDRVDDLVRRHASTASRSKAAPARTSPVLIGSNTFIPGFEEQLVGIARRRARAPSR